MTSMGMVLRCRACGNWYTPLRNIPDVCPHCKAEAQWTTEPGVVEMVVKFTDDPNWKLSHNDRRFLKSLRISAD